MKHLVLARRLEQAERQVDWQKELPVLLKEDVNWGAGGGVGRPCRVTTAKINPLLLPHDAGQTQWIGLLDRQLR